MKHVLICTILRNQVNNLNTWSSLLKGLYHELINYEWQITLSVYENDSYDHTDAHLHDAVLNTDILKYFIKSERLGTQSYGSVWSIDRIRNLANARQKCLDQAGDLSPFDKIAYIEPDIIYDPNWCKELILGNHPNIAGVIPDIYSGWSLRSITNPKESIFLYDTCATRQESSDINWNFEKEREWRSTSLIPTKLVGNDSNCLHSLWSTFNCFCVYNSIPFKKGAKWAYENKFLNASGIIIKSNPNIYLDADTSIICNIFRGMGYGNIFINTNCLIRHI